MKDGTVEYWHQRGFQLDESILSSPGRLLNTAGNPYYLSDQAEPWYVGHEIQTIASRYIVGKRLGRVLARNELVRFKTENKKDFLLSNFQLKSNTAPAFELYAINGPPIYGYSHCMCKCGTALDIERQKDHPYAFTEGHRPSDITRKRTQKAAMDVPRRKKSRRKKAPHQEKDTTPLPSTQELIDEIVTPIPDVPSEEMESFRPLFENMISHLPWKQFKQILNLLMDLSMKPK